MEDEIRRARFDTGVTQPMFMEKVRALQLDLAARLRLRVRSLSRVPTPVLRALWELLVSNRRYEPDEVFHQIAKVRNRSVHAVGSDPAEALRLPWEEVPFHLMTEQLLLLIAEVISVYEEDVAHSVAQSKKQNPKMREWRSAQAAAGPVVVPGLRGSLEGSEMLRDQWDHRGVTPSRPRAAANAAPATIKARTRR